MATKASGKEPTIKGVVGKCPLATMNPTTMKPFTPKYIRNVFETDCFDIVPVNPWAYRGPVVVGGGG